MKRKFNPSVRIIPLLGELGDSLEEMLNAVQAQLEEKPPELSELPGGEAIESLLGEIVEPLSMQLRIMADLVGSRKFSSRIYVFRPNTEVDEEPDRKWAANSPQYADPAFFSTEPEDLLSVLEQWQKTFAPNEDSIGLWVHGVEVLGQSLFVVLMRHSCGTIVPFLVRDQTWNRVPPGDRALFMLLEAELRKTTRVREFWTASVSQLIGGLIKSGLNNPSMPEPRMSDKDLLKVFQACIETQEGMGVVQAFARHMAHGPLFEAQSLLEAMTGLVDHTVEALRAQEVKVRKEQGATIKKLQSSLERQRVLYDGIKNRADRLGQEVVALKQAAKASASAQSKAVPEPGTLETAVSSLLVGC